MSTENLPQQRSVTITFRALSEFIGNWFALRSFIGFIDDFKDSQEKANEVAMEIEDFTFLHQMVTQKEYNDENFALFHDYRNFAPIVLPKKSSYSIDSLAKLAFENNRMREDACIDFIKNLADSQNINPDYSVNEFNSYYYQRKNLYRLEFEKIQNNEQCPCGSGKKYKQCHGKHQGA